MKTEKQIDYRLHVAGEFLRFITPLMIAGIFFLGQQVWTDIKEIKNSVNALAVSVAVNARDIDNIKRRSR